jgi:hypothetical protein
MAPRSGVPRGPRLPVWVSRASHRAGSMGGWPHAGGTTANACARRPGGWRTEKNLDQFVKLEVYIRWALDYLPARFDRALGFHPEETPGQVSIWPGTEAGYAESILHGSLPDPSCQRPSGPVPVWAVAVVVSPRVESARRVPLRVLPARCSSRESRAAFGAPRSPRDAPNSERAGKDRRAMAARFQHWRSGGSATFMFRRKECA